ncbi:MAG: DoxX family protein [Muribaculaceae bacterium]|nr:DoxX family protein [Muribaculaceae bacterium]
MQFSLLSRFGITKGKSLPPTLISVATWVARLLVGVTFVVSGFVKAIDPWGSLYKFGEYFQAMGLPSIDNLTLAAVVLLCVYEFTVGISFIFGCYRRSTPIMALLFMLVMLPLTLWIAVSDPVKDCGCFGDFIILSNWATFYKNVVLTLLIVWLLKYNSKSITIISPAFQWMESVLSIALIAIVSFVGYMVQPLLDFRTYKIGTELISYDGMSTDDSDEPTFRFIYAKDGVEQAFGEDDALPDEESGWEFVRREEVATEAPVAKDAQNEDAATDSDERTFRIWSEDGENDVSEDLVRRDNRVIMLLMPDLTKVSPATTWKINQLYDWSVDMQMDMIAVVAGDSQSIEIWKDLSMPEYGIYTGDDTAIKEVARGNPAVVYIEDGKVRWKRTLSSLDVESLIMAHDRESVMRARVESDRQLKQYLFIYILGIAFLVLISMVPRIGDKIIMMTRRCRSLGKEKPKEKPITEGKTEPTESDEEAEPTE